MPERASRNALHNSQTSPIERPLTYHSHSLTFFHSCKEFLFLASPFSAYLASLAIARALGTMRFLLLMTSNSAYKELRLYMFISGRLHIIERRQCLQASHNSLWNARCEQGLRRDLCILTPRFVSQRSWMKGSTPIADMSCACGVQIVQMLPCLPRVIVHAKSIIIMSQDLPPCIDQPS